MSDDKKTAPAKTTRIKRAMDGLLSKAQVADLSKAPGPKKVITMSAIRQFIDDLLAQYGGEQGIQRAVSDLASLQLEYDQLKGKVEGLQAQLKAAKDSAQEAAQSAEAALKDAQESAETARKDADERLEKLLADHAKEVQEWEEKWGLVVAEKDGVVKDHYATEERLSDAIEERDELAQTVAANKKGMAELEKEIKGLESKLKEANSGSEKLEKRYAALEDQLKDAAAERAKLGEERDDLAAWAKQLEQALAAVKETSERGLVRSTSSKGAVPSKALGSGTGKTARKTVRREAD